jgi:DNA polymerase-3 subunit beta
VKIVTDRAALANAAKWVSKAIPRNPPTPVLNGMVIQSTEAGVRLAAFDYELSAEAAVDSEVLAPGSVLVPGLAFTQFLAAVQDREVTLTDGDGSSITVACGRASATFRLLAVDDYPWLPKIEDGTSLGEVDGGRLGVTVRRLLPFASREPTDIKWAEAFGLDGTAGSLTVTVGTRYALGREGFEAALSDFSVCVPAQRFADAIADFDETVTLHHNGGNLSIVGESRTASIRTYDSTVAFPAKLAQMLESKRTATVAFDRDSINRSLKLIATASDRVRLEPSVYGLNLTSYKPESGEAKSEVSDQIDCEADGAGSFVVALRYLTPIVAGMAGDRIEVGYVIGTTKPATATDGTTRYVFMPVSVKEGE